MKYKEEEILKDIASSYGTDEYFDRISDITGVFAYGCITSDKIEYLVDPAGMQSLCSGIINGHFYLTSHPQLVGDICNLQMDGFVQKLVNYKWYGRVMGPYLPADLTPFYNLKRVIPNNYYSYDNSSIKHKRFWPIETNRTATLEDYCAVIKEASIILKNSMILVANKWKHPWISLTGGIDSNTTFAAANGIYDKFESFSYISSDKEIVDAEAAKIIANSFDVSHHEYYIPTDNSDINDFEIRRELFRHNIGYIAELKDYELRKKLYLRDYIECDVEVKSWVSETIRAYWYKHYGRKQFPKMSGKLFRNLYKIFLLNRKLAHELDKMFSHFIEDYEYDLIPINYQPADMHFNEVTCGSWGGMNISEMKYSNNITTIYNNRKLLELLLIVPLNLRIIDKHHLDIKKELNRELYDMGIRVSNKNETKFRSIILNIIFTFNSVLPFYL